MEVAHSVLPLAERARNGVFRGDAILGHSEEDPTCNADRYANHPPITELPIQVISPAVHRTR